jgi:hypothetical protein
MARFAFFDFTAACAVIAVEARAADVAMSAGLAAAPGSVEAAHLFAREIAARAQGNGFANGRFTPTVPHPAAIRSSAAAPANPIPACGDIKGLAADTTDTGGMRFMPLRRDGVHQFKMPTRTEAAMRAQAFQAAIAGGKGESVLAQAALEADAQAAPAVQAQAELAKVTGAAPPPASADDLAKEAVLREIQKYRAAHGKF